MARSLIVTLFVALMVGVVASRTYRSTSSSGKNSSKQADLPDEQTQTQQQDQQQALQKDDGILRVEVPRRPVAFYPGSSVSVRCRVTGGSKADEYPRVSFYYQMNKFTIMPLGSGTQGVTIRTRVVDSDRDVHRVINLLELGPELYTVLREGDNNFYCKGSLPNGRSVREYFVIRKPRQKVVRAKLFANIF